MNPIMPYGYSFGETRKRLEEKLRAERAQDLAAATTVEERIRIEREINQEVDAQIQKIYPHKFGSSGVLW